MRDLTFFKNKVFPLNISSQMTVMLENQHQPVVTDNRDYYFGEQSQIIRTLKADNLTLDTEQTAILQDFYHEMQGSKYLFLVKDPFYNYSDRVFIAFGGDLQAEFTLVADIGGGAYDNIYPYADGLELYIDNILQPADTYDFTDGGTVLFNTPPELGAEITANFHYDVIMRFGSSPLNCIPNSNNKNYNIHIILI